MLRLTLRSVLVCWLVQEMLHLGRPWVGLSFGLVRLRVRWLLLVKWCCFAVAVLVLRPELGWLWMNRPEMRYQRLVLAVLLLVREWRPVRGWVVSWQVESCSGPTRVWVVLRRWELPEPSP